MPAAKLGAVLGVVTAIGGPTVVVLAYLAITFAYSSEKKMIIQQVKEHLTLADIEEDPVAFAAIPLHIRQRNLDRAKATSAKITAKCLSRWDGLLGLRAVVDSNGKRSGIWMDKFETVRAGSMLRALQRVNATRASEPAGKLIRLIGLIMVERHHG